MPSKKEDFVLGTVRGLLIKVDDLRLKSAPAVR
jgi:hypothetical protein